MLGVWRPKELPMTLRTLSLSLSLAVALPALLAACNSSGDDAQHAQPDAAAAACSSLAGTWTIAGACGPDLCVISQSGCTTHVSCSNGAASYAGSVSNNSFSYAGTTSSGVPASCTGTLAGSSISGTCTVSGAPCSFTGTR